MEVQESAMEVQEEAVQNKFGKRGIKIEMRHFIFIFYFLKCWVSHLLAICFESLNKIKIS